MPRKKKGAIKKVATQAEVETSDDQTEQPRRSLRPRSKAEAKVIISRISAEYLDSRKTTNKIIKDEVKTDSENAYDADSELDQNPGSDSGSDCEEERMVPEKQTKTQLNADVIMDENHAGATKDPYVGVLGNQRPFVVLDKENLTPPGSHSTPNVVQRAVRNLDESLFGFNDLESPLKLSPVQGTLYGSMSPSSSSRCSTVSASPAKRKLAKIGVSDIPIENPKKRTRKKQKKEPPQEVDPFEEFREEFEIVDMHELVIEVD